MPTTKKKSTKYVSFSPNSKGGYTVKVERYFKTGAAARKYYDKVK